MNIDMKMNSLITKIMKKNIYMTVRKHFDTRRVHVKSDKVSFANTVNERSDS